MDFTEQQLRELAIDVGYELKMVAEVGPMASPPQLQSLGSARLEATMLHVRNLDSFLGASEPTDDGVIARHYLDTWTPIPVLTDVERIDLNKRLMHLSQQRLRLHANWNRPAFAVRTVFEFDAFHQLLRDAYPARAAWFDADVANAKTRLAQPIAIALT
jgi:hypothetical protein